MEFIQQNMGIIVPIIVVVCAIVIGFLVAYFKRKGVIKEGDTQLTQDMLTIFRLLLESTKLKNKETKDKALLIVTISEQTVGYIEQMMKYDNNKEKKKAAVETVIKVLAKLDVEVTDSIEQLIDITIESAVNKLPKTNNLGG